MIGNANDFWFKGNGMGDLEILYDPAPIELGNRVWTDADGNGIQDPGEAPIAGVTVELWADTDANGSADTLVGTAVTSAAGTYYFVSGTAADPNPGDNQGSRLLQRRRHSAQYGLRGSHSERRRRQPAGAVGPAVPDRSECAAAGQRQRLGDEQQPHHRRGQLRRRWSTPRPR